MAPRARFGFALLLLTALVSGVVGQLGVHAHALGETDLVAHALIAIDHAPSPHAATHFDRARELEHPACQDCLLASLRADVTAEPPRSPGLDVASAAAVTAGVDAPRRLADGRAPARAPPSA